MGWKSFRGPSLMVLFLVTATALGLAFQKLSFPETNIVLCYLFAVVLTAWLTDGYLYGVICCVAGMLLFNWFFAMPIHTLTVDDPNYWVTFIIMTIIAVIISTLTSHVKQSAQEAQKREQDTRTLYHLTQHLTNAKNREEAERIAIQAIEESVGCPVNFIDIESGSQKSAEPEQTGESKIFHVGGAEHIWGALELRGEKMQLLDSAQIQLIKSIADTLALAIDRITALELHIRSSEEAEKERYRGDLLRAISHDLRTPLAGIMGMTEMLEHELEDRPECKEIASGIYRDADWLHSLVENILNLTRLQSGSLTLNRDMEAIEEVIGSAINHIARRTGERKITVDAPDDFLTIPMDARLIEQVIINLLDNAIKHTPEDGEILIKVCEQAENVCISVLDRGSGIAPSDIPNIFQMFYTSCTGRPDASPGVGLGLTICEAIVRAHGGSISASNREDGAGAEFCFVLPKNVPQEENS